MVVCNIVSWDKPVEVFDGELWRWAIGGTWGSVDDKESLAAPDRAVDLGVNFIDTVDVYGDGRSERLVGGLRRRRKEEIGVATKAGRRLSPPRPTVITARI